jgi:hypothetical protein
MQLDRRSKSAIMPRMAKYDLAISFAGEQRELADSIARRLDAAGYSVFYDRFALAELWAADLPVELSSIYADEARFCLVIVSREYIQKAWTNLERQNAISRFMRDRKGYLLCLKTDSHELPGLPTTVGYIDLRVTSPDEVYGAILQKLGLPDHEDRVSPLSPADVHLARLILEACFTRAIFTRMDGEISVSAMYESIRQTTGTLQSLIPKATDQGLQHDALLILAALDEVDRTSKNQFDDFGMHADPRQRLYVDHRKQTVVTLLLQIKRKANLAMHMPSELERGYFFNAKSASEPPY